MEKLWWGLVILVFGIVILGIVLGSVGLIFQLLWYSSVAWLTATAVFAAAFLGSLRAFASKAAVARHPVTLEEKDLTWVLSARTLEGSSVKAHATIASALAFATLAALLVVTERAGWFARTWWHWDILMGNPPVYVPSGIAAFLASVLSSSIIGVVIWRLVPYGRRSSVRAAERLAGFLNIHRGKADAYLAECSSITRMVDELGIKTDIPYTRDIVDFATARKAELVTQPWKIAPVIARAYQAVCNDVAQLQVVMNIKQSIHGLLTETSKVVNRTGSKRLAEELEKMYEGLASPELAEFLSKRQWEDYITMVQQMECELQELKAMAQRYLEAEIWEEQEEEFCDHGPAPVWWRP